MSDRPKALIIGDSISMHMMPFLEKELAGEFAVRHNQGNASDSRNIVALLDEWLAADSSAQLVHLNCGLHDIKLAVGGKAHQVPLHEYRENLIRIVARLRAAGKALVWAMTTPVLDQRHRATHAEFNRCNKDVLERNAVAGEIMAQAGLPINDLYAAVNSDDPELCIGDDGVHMTEAGSKLLAAAVARAIREHLAS